MTYLQEGGQIFLRCHLVYKVKMKNYLVDKYKSRLVGGLGDILGPWSSASTT